MNMGLMTFIPLFNANFVPICAPIIINTATGIPYRYSILPLKANRISAVILETKFRILAFPEAVTKSKP